MADDFGDNKDDDMKLDAELLKILEDYAGCDADSAKINERRLKLRTKADKLGVSSHALQDGVYKLKKQTKAERLADEKATRRLVRAAEGRQAELWPEAVAATEKRAERKKERENKAAAAAGKESPEAMERRLAADLNPRSKPKASSAKKPKAEKASKDNVVALNRAPLNGEPTPEQKAVADAEQQDGATILDTTIAGIPKVDADGKPLSQSAIAQQKLDAALHPEVK